MLFYYEQVGCCVSVLGLFAEKVTEKESQQFYFSVRFKRLESNLENQFSFVLFEEREKKNTKLYYVYFYSLSRVFHWLKPTSSFIHVPIVLQLEI